MQEQDGNPPGTESPQRFRPKLRYELIGCGLHGHELVGTEAARLREEDALFARESGGLRWYRCLRCDSWLPLGPPRQPSHEYPPERDEIELPLRGRPLRDRYVLRAIAVDRAIHVVLLAGLAVIIFAFAGHKAVLRRDYFRILDDLQGGAGGPVGGTGRSAFTRFRHFFRITPTHLYEVGAFVTAYALLEAAEMVGLWFAKRWAEYLTFVATTLLIPFEVTELVHNISILKVLTLVINIAVAVYLLLAKRLFGLRGGGRAEEAERARDSGWEALERSAPGTEITPA
ncbi:MAG TPA: DUF2127 domain-containing protein [Actinomycetota bacterium]|nr:DUF2127 domain-containing protein [Actinomycetota bacterium]